MEEGNATCYFARFLFSILPTTVFLYNLFSLCFDDGNSDHVNNFALRRTQL